MLKAHALVLALLSSADAETAKPKPNFVWLHVESTDGRTYQDDMGANFVNAYCNVPICCPSRASVWAGREGHNMPHETNGIKVNGAWNNYEGFGQKKGEGFDTMKISDRLQAQANYTVKIVGKEDWLTGSHSLNTMIDSFSIYSRWPYDIPAEGPGQGGFHIWGDCGGNVSINPGNQTAHAGDWKGVRTGTDWLTDAGAGGAAAAQPFFFYDGMVIVHPPYHTDQLHWDRIPAEKVTAPEWPALDDEAKVHPCDLQMSMKKGCAYAAPHMDAPGGAPLALDSVAHKVGVRRAYYAMISEFDDMVGEYVAAVARAHPTVAGNTVFVVSSDHGDMQLEHAQFYKMSAFEGSTRVPIVISGPGVNAVGNVNTLVSLVDLMPTFLDLAGVPPPPKFVSGAAEGANDPAAVDGVSLVPLLERGDDAKDSHPDHVMSQFHGENAGMSWFMLRRGEMKLVQWGTGEQHLPQLFNLSADPGEWTNLALDPAHNGTIAALDALLRAKVDYPEVARDVARYNIQMARWWTHTEPKWREILGGTGHSATSQPPGGNCSKAPLKCELSAGDEAYWGEIWRGWPEGYWAAWNKWINGSIGEDVSIPACPSGLVHNWHKSQDGGRL